MVEAKSEGNSFGLIKHRSTHDGISAIISLLDKITHSKWVLDVDIAKWFDRNKSRIYARTYTYDT